MPSAPSLWPGGQACASVPQSPRVSCCHQLATAACANTTLWLMPHLQAAQRRMSAVVPVKSPLIRGASIASACSVSPDGKKWVPTRWPTVRLYGWLAALFSGHLLSLTQRVHSAPVGSASSGGRVWKTIPRAGRVELGAGLALAVCVWTGGAGGGVEVGVCGGGAAGGRWGGPGRPRAGAWGVLGGGGGGRGRAGERLAAGRAGGDAAL